MNPERVYVSGLSGGGKMASMVAIDHAHLFKGAIYNCGVEFWDSPPRRIAEIRRHHPNLYEVFFLFIGTGIALGGFLWLVLPIYQDWRQLFAVWAIENDHFWLAEPGPAWLMSVHPERREVFVWIDFLTISGFMLAVTALFTALLSMTTALAAWASGRVGGDRGFRQRFAELGYQYAPIAMVSLVIGLGGELFQGLSYLGLAPVYQTYAKAAFFLVALLWSLALGLRILDRQAVRGWAAALPMLPGVLGTLGVGLGWWWAVIGF